MKSFGQLLFPLLVTRVDRAIHPVGRQSPDSPDCPPPTCQLRITSSKGFLEYFRTLSIPVNRYNFFHLPNDDVHNPFETYSVFKRLKLDLIIF